MMGVTEKYKRESRTGGKINLHKDILFLYVGRSSEDDRKNIPLGIAHLCGVLRSAGFSYTFTDLYNLNPDDAVDLPDLYEKILYNTIKIYTPALVGIGASSYYIKEAGKTVKIIRKIAGSPEINYYIPVILGGYISLVPEYAVKTGADIICIGEAEYTLKELMEVLIRGEVCPTDKPLYNNPHVTEELRKIRGIIFFDGRKYINTGRRSPIKNLDGLPFPDYRVFDLEKYGLKNSLPFYTQRGCYNNCTFCDIIPFYGIGYIRRTSPGEIVRRITRAVCEFGIKRIEFMDDNFLNHRKFVSEFFERLAEKFAPGAIPITRNLPEPRKTVDKPSISITFQARANEIVRFGDILNTYREYINCIEIGTESYSQSQLDRWNKNITVFRNTEANTILSELKIPYINYYLWLDGETTVEELDENLEVLFTQPPVPAIGIYLPVPNFVINYEISAIYDRLGRSSVRDIPYLSACEEFLNTTYRYAGILSDIYLAALLVEETGTLEGKNTGRLIANITVSIREEIEKILTERLYGAVNLTEDILHKRILRAKYAKRKVSEYTERFIRKSREVIEAAERLGIFGKKIRGNSYGTA